MTLMNVQIEQGRVNIEKMRFDIAEAQRQAEINQRVAMAVRHYLTTNLPTSYTRTGMRFVLPVIEVETRESTVRLSETTGD
jgi:hypothetical protein